jgi:sporulation protein YlmC with PRC-barrel domain
MSSMAIKSLALALVLAAGSAGAGLKATPSDADAKAPNEAVVPMTGLPRHQSLISAYYKAKVYDESHYKVGEIKDMLVDRNGRINAVLLSVGGFLGGGEKDVAVPFDSIKINERDGRSWFSLNVTKQTLRSAPAYIYDHRSAEWEPRLAKD